MPLLKDLRDGSASTAIPSTKGPMAFVNDRQRDRAWQNHGQKTLQSLPKQVDTQVYQSVQDGPTLSKIGGGLHGYAQEPWVDTDVQEQSDHRVTLRQGRRKHDQHFQDSHKSMTMQATQMTRSVFDDTASLSFLDGHDHNDEDRTAILNKPIEHQKVAPITSHTRTSDEDDTQEIVNVQDLEIDLGNHRQKEADVASGITGKRPAYTTKDSETQPDCRPQHQTDPDTANPIFDTPSRSHSRSAPLREYLHHPQPPKHLKTVGFASPEFHSASYEQESIFEVEQPRNVHTSATWRDSMPARSKGLAGSDYQQRRQHPQQLFSSATSSIRPKKNLTSQKLGRSRAVPNMSGHSMSPSNAGKEAAWSDQESLDMNQPSRSDSVADLLPQVVQAKKKRSWGDDLDYDLNTLRGKSLADLQQEPFVKLSNVALSLEVTGTNSGTRSLSEQLEDLTKMTDPDRRGFFGAQTDDEWAQTGQWFVDKFQANLKRLMDVRVQKREIALNFEVEIKKRQRVVQLVEARVERELKELQHGGGELLKGREPGSRSGTPVRPTKV